MNVVTRVEVVDAVKTAFHPTVTPAYPKGLVAAATEAGARPAVVDQLQTLDEGLHFRTMRELWHHFPLMPVTSPE